MRISQLWEGVEACKTPLQTDKVKNRDKQKIGPQQQQIP